jgi:guanylate kinase
VSVLLVVAGPSGTGKGSVIRRLRAADPGLWFSVSATDRDPRPDEVDGEDYLFVSTDEFERMRDDEAFLEWFEVFGDLKGTPRAPIEEHLGAGEDVVVEVDVQGALAIREAFPNAFLVFVRPPSRAVQRDRLLARAEEEASRSGMPSDPSDLERRLEEADAEEGLADQFDAVVVNDDLDRALGELTGLLEARRESGSG